MEMIVQTIQNVGFPVVSFLLAAYFIKYSYDKSQEITHSAIDQVGKLADAVNNNTETLVKLTEHIGKNCK